MTVNKQTSFKKAKLTEKILADANYFLRSEVNDPRLTHITFSRVELNDDASKAELYWDTFQTEEKKSLEKAVSSVQGKIRTYLASTLKLRAVPEVAIRYDSQVEDELAIERLLKE